MYFLFLFLPQKTPGNMWKSTEFQEHEALKALNNQLEYLMQSGRSCELSCACLEFLLIELHCRNFYCFYLLLSRNDFEPVALHNRFLDSRTNEIGIRCSLATISAYRLSRGFPLVLLQVMLNVFVTERVQMLRGTLFELFLWAWISHLLSLKSIFTCRCLCVHFFRILSWHFAVYRPKHDFCCDSDEVLRCIMI